MEIISIRNDLPQCFNFEVIETLRITIKGRDVSYQLPLLRGSIHAAAAEVHKATAEGREVTGRVVKLLPPWTEATYIPYRNHQRRVQRAVVCQGVAA